MIQLTAELFKRATSKYDTDYILWKGFVDFSIRYHYQTKEILNRAINLHPNVVQLWLLQAKYYFELENDTTSARNTLQRSLQMNKNSSELWIQFIKMELLLALPSVDDVVACEELSKNDEEKNTEKEDVMSDDEDNLTAEEKREKRLALEQQRLKQLAKDIEQPEELYKMPFTIINEMIKREDFLNDAKVIFDIIELLSNFPKTLEKQQFLLNLILNHHVHDEHIIYKAITYPIYHPLMKVDRYDILKQLHKKATIMQSKIMYTLTSKFAIENQYHHYYLQKIFPEANQSHCLSEYMCYDYFALMFERPVNEAKNYELIRELLNVQLLYFPESIPLLSLYLKILVGTDHISMAIDHINYLRSSRAAILMKPKAWTPLFELLELNPNKKKLLDLYREAMTRCPEDPTIRDHLLRYALSNPSIMESVVSLFTTLSSNSLDLYKVMINTLMNHAMYFKKTLERLLLRATSDFGHEDHSIWIDFLTFCYKTNQGKRAQHIYQDAVSKLRSID
eukprot:CAMPEP_0117422152 /NCGR_PEP_ID=MMETSP0758-20121206/3050_1 /TAXON_ID=63605 /ORGANISM="Percolomonas cosmopolitus, Strain AE-1 (ATCC 50343)" /LENGTH=507 /DNA_ID=CAMNT_0005204603 /DNA_START=153 /DNA_END=1673 /DNA_ORIENTATION=+